jgi:type IV secretory pathway ATPase VirB11/archaellum biosynthesis ATPase
MTQPADDRMKTQLAGLLDTLDLLVAQVRAYERALPSDNYPARAAVASLGEPAHQALTEAQDLAAALEPAPPAAHPFSPRELEVLILVGQGLTNKEIAFRLGLSERTIQFHLNSVFNKTNTSSRTEAHALLLKALDYGLSILVTGNKGSGKTSITHLLAESIPADKRVVVVANAFELPIRHPRRIHLEASDATAPSMTNLLGVAAKMRPDWLVMGELQGSEAMRAIQLLSSDYRGISTLYASSPADALTRLEAMCLMANLGLSEIRTLIASAVRLITYQQNHTLPDYRRKITRIVEVAGVENGRYVLQPLFNYDVEQGKLEPTSARMGWEERIRQAMTHG